MLVVVGTKASLTFEKEASIDAVLANCKSPDASGSIPPDKLVAYGDQNRYKVKIPVKRPPPLGPHASSFGEEDRWILHETFLKAMPQGEEATSDDEVGFAAYLQLVKKIVEEQHKGTTPPPDDELKRILEEVR